MDFCQLHHGYTTLAGPIVTIWQCMVVAVAMHCNVAPERHLFVKSNLWNGATTAVELDLGCHAQTNPSLQISLSSSSLSQDQNHLEREVKGETWGVVDYLF